MPTHYGPPHRIYTVTGKGKRRLLNDKTEAERVAKEISRSTGVPFSEVFSEMPYYFVREYVTGAPSRRVSTKCRTLTEAKAWCRRRERESLGPVRHSGKDFKSAIEEWLDVLTAKGRGENTVLSYRFVANTWEKHFHKPVGQVNQADIVAYLKVRSSIATEKGKTRKASARTMNLSLTLLRSFFRWARRQGYTEQDPTDGLSGWTQPKKEPRVLKDSEVAALLKACREPFTVTGIYGRRNAGGRRGGASKEAAEKWTQTRSPPPALYPAVVLALTSLLRLGNILGLRWGEVDFEDDVIRIPPERVKTRNELVLPLSKAARRTILELPKGGPDDLVFGVTEVKRSFSSALKRAKIKGASFHALRRTGATHLLRKNVPYEVVERLGGWRASGGVMMQHYRAVGMDELRKAVEILDGLVMGEGVSRASVTSSPSAS